MLPRFFITTSPKPLLLGSVDGFCAELLEHLGQFQRSLAGAGAGSLIAFYHVSFGVFYETIDLLFDLIK